MSSKYKLIIICCLLILLNIFSIIYILVPKVKIDINGKENIYLNVNEEYIEKGATAYKYSIFGKKTVDLKTTGSVNNKKIGKYIITYEANYKWGTMKKNKTVNVVDKQLPKIILNNEIKMCKNNNLLEIDVEAIDNYDGDISKNIDYEIKNNKIYLSVMDSSNNKTILEENVNYIDDEPPIITLKGSEVVYININGNYDELGATAYDSCEGDITKKIKINSNINLKETGEYNVTYEVEDELGNKDEIVRKVIVVDNSVKEEVIYPIINGATIYLTFDDGPYKYTEDILKILDTYNIKATFFVTNQFPKYQYVIKKEYEAGHAIGIHTYSHQWSIYESRETYLDDFKKIDDIVYNETGMHTKIFRFPGGSSNQVSRNYCKGIMTELAKYMTEQNYIYFDWNVDSGDTNKKDNSTKAIIKNVKKSLKGDGNYIVLMHDIKKNTLEALPEIIEYALSLGYEFKSLDENSPEIHFRIAN